MLEVSWQPIQTAWGVVHSVSQEVVKSVLPSSFLRFWVEQQKKIVIKKEK